MPEITWERVIETEDFDADDVGTYESYGFESDAQAIARRITELQRADGVESEMIFGFDANSEGEIDGATVSIWDKATGLYVVKWLELKHLTDDRDALGGQESGKAIMTALLGAYEQALVGWRRLQVRS